MGWNIDLPDAEWFTPSSPNFEGLIRAVKEQREIALDTETTGLNVVKDIPLYWSLSWGSGMGARRICMPASTMHYFRESFDDPKKQWIFANAKFDMHMLAQVGINIAGSCIDTQVMHALLYEEKPHGLKAMAKQILGWGWKDFFDTFEPLKILADIKDGSDGHEAEEEEPPKTRARKPLMRKESIGEMLQRFERENLMALVEYASNDAYGTFQLYLDLKQRLEEEITWSLYPDKFPTMWSVFDKTEKPFTKVLWKCERNGLLIDVDYLQSIKGPVEDGIEQLGKEISKIVGRVFNPRSSDMLREYFFREKGYRSYKQTSGGKSGVKKEAIDAAVLEALAAENDPVAKKVLEFRELDKLYGTYILGLSKHLDSKNRIHCRLNQDIARCMPAGELVLTNRGYLPVEQVLAGDLVISHTGVPRKIVETSQHAPQPIYQVRLSNGLTLRTTGNHEYRTGSGWTRADELVAGQAVTVHSNKETWLPIHGWKLFEVSSWGRVRNRKTGTILTQRPKGKWGHLKVTLYRDGAQQRRPDKKDFSVHRLVLGEFGPGRRYEQADLETRHLNGIAWDNTIRNLRLGTSLENRQDALKHGTMSQRRAGRTVLTPEQVRDIRATSRTKQPPSSTAKLNFEKAQRIREAHADGSSISELASAYGVSCQAIHGIVKKRTYATPPCESAKPARYFAEKYGVSVGYIREIQSGAKWRDEDYIEGSFATFYEAHVVDVVIQPPETTYGLTVEQDHSHVTGGIVTHNTGRLSSSNPNLQNIPKPEFDKYRVRRAFIAPPDHDLIVVDYDQLEMRLLAAAAQEPDMVNIFLSGKDIHMGNAELVFGDIYEKRYGRQLTYDDLVKAKKIDKKVKEGELPQSEITEWVTLCLFARSAIKTIGFGLNYGMREKKLAANIGVPVEEALAIMEAYLARYPTVKRFFDDSVEDCRASLKTYTLIGRRRFLPEINAYNKYERLKAERQAGNTIIQGTAADAARLAMIACDEAQLDWHYGAQMLLQVHDELIFQCPKENSKECLAEIKEWMEHPFPTDLMVPLTASGGIGPNWMDAK